MDNKQELNWQEEIERLNREGGHVQTVKEMLSEILPEEPNRDELIEILTEATLKKRDESPVVSKITIADQIDMTTGQPTSVLETNITRKGFFSDPETIEKYGSTIVNRARNIILDFTSKKAGI